MFLSVSFQCSFRCVIWPKLQFERKEKVHLPLSPFLLLNICWPLVACCIHCNKCFVKHFFPFYPICGAQMSLKPPPVFSLLLYSPGRPSINYLIHPMQLTFTTLTPVQMFLEEKASFAGEYSGVSFNFQIATGWGEDKLSKWSKWSFSHCNMHLDKFNLLNLPSRRQ